MSVIERLGVIGDPIDHSLSPAMQTVALHAAGLDWTYTAERVPVTALTAAVDRLRREQYRGFNVTVPHKVAVAGHLDSLAGDVQRTGAVNTVVRDGNRLIGHNTDVAGFRAALHAAVIPPDIEQVVVFGAGGAARAVVVALSDLGLAPLIVNREQRRAKELAGTVPGATTLEPEDLRLTDILATSDLVINATSLGMGALRERSPLPSGVSLRPGALVIDLVYGSHTPFLATAAASGCRTSDGIEMLVQQGAVAFRLWTERVPDLDVMRNACRTALLEDAPC